MIKKVMDKVVEDLGKTQEKEKTKKHVIMFDIPESKRAEIRQRTSHDKKRCEEVFYDELDVKEAKIKCIFRVGRGSKSLLY